MSDHAVGHRLAAASRSKGFWTIAGAGVLGIGVLGLVLPGYAFATEKPQLVSANATTQADNTLRVTMRCPRGMTAVGVTASTSGFSGVTIDRMWPQGRSAVAEASATREVTSPWSLHAAALCVKKTADIEYVVDDRGAGAPAYAQYGNRRYDVTTCRSGKELIGFGWSTDPGTWVDLVNPFAAQSPGYPPTGTGTGYYPPTGTGYYPPTSTGTGYYPPTGTGTYGLLSAVGVGTFSGADGPAKWKTATVVRPPARARRASTSPLSGSRCAAWTPTRGFCSTV